MIPSLRLYVLICIKENHKSMLGLKAYQEFSKSLSQNVTWLSSCRNERTSQYILIILDPKFKILGTFGSAKFDSFYDPYIGLNEILLHKNRQAYNAAAVMSVKSNLTYKLRLFTISGTPKTKQATDYIKKFLLLFNGLIVIK